MKDAFTLSSIVRMLIITFIAIVLLLGISGSAMAQDTDATVIDVGDQPMVIADEERPPTDIQSDAEAVEAILMLIKAIQEGQWILAVSLALSLAVWLVERFKLLTNVKEPWYSIAGVVIPIIGALATQLFMLDGPITFQTMLLVFVEAFAVAGGVTLIGNAIQSAEARAAAT